MSLDEDGLCRLSELPPEQCGCDKHRGAKLDGADEAIIDDLVRGQVFGGTVAQGRFLTRNEDNKLPGKWTAE
jgi:hypothetical protein